MGIYMLARNNKSIVFKQYIKGDLLDLSHIKEYSEKELGVFEFDSEFIPSLMSFLNSHPAIKELNLYITTIFSFTGLTLLYYCFFWVTTLF